MTKWCSNFSLILLQSLMKKDMVQQFCLFAVTEPDEVAECLSEPECPNFFDPSQK